MGNDIKASTEVITKPKLSKIDKIIATYCFIGIAVNIHLAWSHLFHGNDTIKFIIGNILATFGGLLFYVLFIHGLPNALKILVGTGISIFNLYLIFNYKSFVAFIKFK